MKKNFFKKLSFVLALAMIVSVLAPAAGAFAAAKAPKLNATKKYLHLSRDNEYDFNISNKQKGWKYDWSSANENVAEVNGKNGVVTATGAGTTKVSVVIYDKDGEEYATLKATVVVRDNIKTVKISNAPENNTLKVNESFDFNRSYTTEANKTKGSESVTRWSVDKAGATITDAGVFTATEAGKYVVTARSFQSKAKYDAWKALKDEAATLNVLATDTVEITVAASVVSTKQINKVKFAVTFDADMSKTDLSATTAKLFQVINGTKVNTGTEKIKEIKLDATGKVATVEMYSKFNPNTAYEFAYGALVGTFTSAKVDLKEVASITFDDLSATINTITDLKEKVNGLNADGVVIFNGKDDANFASTLSFSGDLGSNGYLDTNNKSVYIYTKGFSATLTAKFSYYVYNETTKVYDPLNWSDTAVVTGVETDNNVNTSSMQYYVATGEGDSGKTWATTGFKLAADDKTYRISTRYKLNSDKDKWLYDGQTNVASDYTNSKFVYESSNTDKLIVTGDYLYPISEGTVTIIVKLNNTDKTVVGSFDLTIVPARVLASATIDNPSLTVGNHATLGDNASKVLATITVKDSLDEGMLVAATYTTENRPAGYTSSNDPVLSLVPSLNNGNGKVEVKVNSQSSKDGLYYFKIKLNKGNVDKYIFLTVNVLDGKNDLAVTSWRFEIDNTSLDLKKLDETKVFNYGVYGYNSKGAKIKKLVGGSEYNVVIKKDGTDIGRAGGRYDDDKVNVVLAGTPLNALEAGKTYAVEAILDGPGATAMGRPASASGSSIGFVTFTVVDTSVKTFVVDKPTVASGSSLSAMDLVKAALTLYLNGDKVTDGDEANIVAITYYDGQNEKIDDLGTATIGSGSSIYVKSLKYRVSNASKSTVTEYKFDIGVTIKCE